LALPWGFVLKISNFKHQNTNKSQIPMSKTFKDKPLFRFLNFGHWDLFEIWVLVFGILTNSYQSRCQAGQTPQGITITELSGLGFFMQYPYIP